MRLNFQYSNKTLSLFVLLSYFSLIPNGIYAQITNIPDSNFEQALIDLGIDSDGIINGQVLTSDIESVVTLNVSWRQISDFTGIEDFSFLEELDATRNLMSTLNLTGVNKLNRLIIDDNLNLNIIDVSNNLLLEYLYCSLSIISELDLSNNHLLKELVLGDDLPSGTNIIENLDLSSNTALEKLQLINMDLLKTINLKSGNNENLVDVTIYCVSDFGEICEPFPCLEVDDLSAALNNEYPYSEWQGYINYSEDCSLGIISSNKQLFSIYPNPVKQTLVLNSTNGIGKANIKIYTAEGKLLKNEILEFSKEVSIDVSNLYSGIYFLNIETDNRNRITKKFVKE